MAGYHLRQLGDFVGRMLLPTPMARVGLFFLAEDAPHVVSVLARLGACQVDRIPAELQDYFQPCFPPRFREAYRRLRTQYEPLAERWQMAGQGAFETPPLRVPTVEELDRLSDRLESLGAVVGDVVRQTRQLQQRQWELEHFDEYVRVLAELDIDVAALTDLRFLHVRAGTVPVENLDRLRESAELGGDLVLSLGERGDRSHVMVVGVGGVSPDLEGLLAKAHFEGHAVPTAGVESATLREQMEAEAAAVAEQLRRLEATEAELKQQHRELLLNAGTAAARAAVFVQCEPALEGRAPVAFLGGWVVRDHVAALRRVLAREVANPVAVVQQPAVEHTTESAPPSEILLPRIFQPGVQLVSLYGPPGSGDLNPTLVVAATTPLLFGMMFGDVGHGLLLLLATLALRRWLRMWVAVGVSCSIGSIVFGFLYGSVFGVEHWLPALWVRPMEEPFRLLAAALGMGVALVCVTFLLKTATLLRQREWPAALLGFEGLAGAAFYLSAVLIARAVYLGDAVSPLATATLILALLLIGGQTVAETRRRGSAALADFASEYFHSLITLLTNTLSFLRLAAFALAHAALSLAMFLVMETIPPTPLGWVFRVLVFVAGTAIILVLDGLAVSIQTVRLQFYEGLARYYQGDGQLYRPLQFVDNRDLRSFPPVAGPTT